MVSICVFYDIKLMRKLLYLKKCHLNNLILWNYIVLSLIINFVQLRFIHLFIFILLFYLYFNIMKKEVLIIYCLFWSFYFLQKFIP